MKFFSGTVVRNATRNASALIAVVVTSLMLGASSRAQQSSESRIVPGLAPYSVPAGIAAGPDGNVWFVLTFEGRDGIGRISNSGDVTVFRKGISPAFSPFAIALGPDGNLWFTEDYDYPKGPGMKVARITPLGEITEFSLGTDNLRSALIVAGPDRAMWIAELGQERLDRVDMAGNATAIQLPRGVQVESLVLWRGAIWFSEWQRPGLWRVDASRRLTKISPPRGISPGGLAVGPDHALWFADGGRHVGRMTPDGKFSQFSLPHRGGCAGYLVTVPHGDLWFSEPENARIGRVSARGIVRLYSHGISPKSYPVFITVGPDHKSVWFTETDLGNIGRITPDGTVTEFRSGQEQPIPRKSYAKYC